MNKKISALLTIAALCWGSTALATPILNSDAESPPPDIILTYWAFQWSSDPFQSGIGRIVDLGGRIDPFAVNFNGRSENDLSGSVIQWISTLKGAKYSFEAINLDRVEGELYHTSIGIGSPNDFSAVALRIKEDTSEDNTYSMFTRNALSYDSAATQARSRIIFNGAKLNLYQTVAVPAPAPAFLLISGMIGLILLRSRRQRTESLVAKRRLA